MHIEHYCNDLLPLIEDIDAVYGSFVEQMADDFLDVLNDGKKIMVCGNGGSFAQAQHFAAEFMVRPSGKDIYWRRRNVIALGSNPAFMTACSNDLSYPQLFTTELSTIGEKGDILLILSTSGESSNLERVCRTAMVKEIKTFALLGQVKDGFGGKLASISDVSLVIPSSDVARIQEVHLFVLHVICQIISNKLKK